MLNTLRLYKLITNGYAQENGKRKLQSMVLYKENGKRKLQRHGIVHTPIIYNNANQRELLAM